MEVFWWSHRGMPFRISLWFKSLFLGALEVSPFSLVLGSLLLAFSQFA